MSELSLVISTRNRASRLPALFERLAGITTDRPWELVIVDNGSTDGTGETLRELAEAAAFPVRHVVEPEPGLGRALNAGVRASAAPIVATTDDDCYPAPDYVDRVLDLFDRHAVGFAGGRIRLHDDSHAPVSIVDRPETVLLPSPTFPPPGLIGGANLAFRRTVFDNVGGFDDALGAGTPFPCEDADFCARASARGWDGGYFPEPVVHHDHRYAPGADADAVRRGYARARGAYYAKTLLDLPPLRRECLKWWYWNCSSVPARHVLIEVLSAARYLLGRLARAAVPFRFDGSAHSRPDAGAAGRVD